MCALALTGGDLECPIAPANRAKGNQLLATLVAHVALGAQKR